MNWIEALILGIIQGLSEFLPISSSGHLALIPKFFELKDPGVVFDLVMHVGTAFAVMVYFKQDILSLIREAIEILVKKDIIQQVKRYSKKIQRKLYDCCRRLYGCYCTSSSWI